MNDFFETLQDTVIMAGREIESTAKDVTAKAKLKYEIKQTEGYLDELYKELGKEFYLKNKDEDTENETFKEITELLNELSDLNDSYMDIKGQSICSYCGAYVRKDAVYCDKCGKPLFE